MSEFVRRHLSKHPVSRFARQPGFSFRHYLFVIVADGERIYWGMFLDDVDSYGCLNPVIRLIPRHLNAVSCIPHEFVIDDGYPSASGKGIRDDRRIYLALKNAGKLIE